MDVQHESVEMHPALVPAGHIDRIVEEVHQHRLATPHPAIEVEPQRRLLPLPGKAKPRLPAPRRARIVAAQGVMKALQLFHGQFLGGIARQRPRRDQAAVNGYGIFTHARSMSSNSPRPNPLSARDAGGTQPNATGPRKD
jgi:hypothetical protein